MIGALEQAQEFNSWACWRQWIPAFAGIQADMTTFFLQQTARLPVPYFSCFFPLESFFLFAFPLDSGPSSKRVESSDKNSFTSLKER